MSLAGRASLAAALALAAPAALAETLYKCVTSDGRTMYQSSPCDPSARETPLRSESAAPAPGPATVEGQTGKAARAVGGRTFAIPMPPPRPIGPVPPPGLHRAPPGDAGSPQLQAMLERGEIFEIAPAYQACALAPGITARFGAAYASYERSHAAAFASLRADPAASRALDDKVSESSRMIRARLAEPQGGEAMAKYCESMIGPFLEGRAAGAH